MPATGTPPLLPILQRQIAESGNLSFARFMELALYHPNLGYYRRQRDPFGRAGDFYTAEQLAPFADLIATVVERSGAKRVLELGAGRRELSDALARYGYRGLDWDDADLPPSFSGLILANEFFDALPVHLLTRRDGAWSELTVNYRDGGLVWEPRPLQSLELQAYAARYQHCLPAGDAVLEANLAMTGWLHKLSACSRKSQLLIVDYGYRAPELVRFPEGTLLSYQKHFAYSDVLTQPGGRDITAHVNFTELVFSAVPLGFSVLFEGSLQRWALELSEDPAFQQRWQSADARWRLEWKQLVFGMGETFQVLLLEFESPQV